jgi:hypothetical protein
MVFLRAKVIVIGKFIINQHLFKVYNDQIFLKVIVVLVNQLFVKCLAVMVECIQKIILVYLYSCYL